MANAWKVIWYENGSKYKKAPFPGDSPRASGAIDYAKSIIARGISVDNVHVVSMRKGYAPPQKSKDEQPLGTSWCPYCLKWREFHVSSVMMGEVAGPEDYRCPICLTSVNDYYVNKYNPTLVARSEALALRMTKLKPKKR